MPKLKTPKTSRQYARVAVYVSLIVAILLGMALWDITFWPSDAKDFYLDCAVQLMHVPYLSQIHEDIDAQVVRWGHGKEIFFLCISFLQRCLLDFESLRPIIVLNLMSFAFAAILIFLISRRYWGDEVAIICWFGYTFCLWPYLYILLAKHLSLGLFFFLGAVYLLFFTKDTFKGRMWFFFSGFAFGLALFSSTPSMLYLPCYFAAFVYEIYRLNNFSSGDFNLTKGFKTFVVFGLLMLLGLAATFIYVNFPNIAYNLKSYATHVYLSGHHNHFFYNQPYIQQWFPFQHVDRIRGGWLWVVKYFFLIMPVLFALYGLGLGFLIFMCFKRKNMFFAALTLAIIFLSLAAPLMAEIAPVAQYGANYFPSLMGILLLIGYAFYVAKENGLAPFQGRLRYVVLFVGLLHLGCSLYVFLTDVYPTRMAKTFISQKMKALKITRLFTYKKQPHLKHFLPYFSPDVYKNLRFVPIQTIAQVEEGYIFIPPITGDSIFLAMTSRYNHFEEDLFLNALVARNRLKDYAVCSYATVASSRIWLNEEEILSYRSLILNQPFQDNELGRIWLLDARKFHADLMKNMPLPEDLFLMNNDLLNIGTSRKFFIFEGHQTITLTSRKVSQITTQIFKVGSPADSLAAYVYKVDKDEPVWIPAGARFFSEPLPAAEISHDEAQGIAVFRFASPLDLERGRHLFVIYRTGKPDDKNFYTIHKTRIAIQ